MVLRQACTFYGDQTLVRRYPANLDNKQTIKPYGCQYLSHPVIIEMVHKIIVLEG